MRRVRDLLRLCLENGLSGREAARSLGMSSSTASEYMSRARAANLGWPLPSEMDDDALERLLFGPKVVRDGPRRALPDVGYIKQQLGMRDVTLALLWEEYKRDHPEGYQYSQFCELIRRELRKVDVVMRQNHRGGEKVFVDWAGAMVPIVDADSGDVTRASIFVAVLPASNYTCFRAFLDQQAGSWIRGHVYAYEFFGGVPSLTVPDNTKTAVVQPCAYEPQLSELYQDMATHYGTAIVPARVRKPRDKAAVEVGVQVVQRWVLAALRHRTFFSLAELNRELEARQQQINARPFRRMAGSRRELYERLDRPALRPLPAERYEWLEWKTATVGPDYHVEVRQHYYSVPSELVGQRVDMRVSPVAIEVLHRNRRVTSHLRCYTNQKFITKPEHMPSAHRRYAAWTPQRLCAWAAETGPATAELVQGLMERRPHPEQGFRSAMGLISLGQRYGPERLEAACRRALDARAYSYRSVQSILRSGLDQAPTEKRVHRSSALPLHENIRGAAYYGEDA